MSDGGKGSNPRPFSVSRKTYEENFDRIFQKTPKDIDDLVAEEEEFNFLESTIKLKSNDAG